MFEMVCEVGGRLRVGMGHRVRLRGDYGETRDAIDGSRSVE